MFGWSIMIIGLLIALIASFVGLGGLLFTRFGRRDAAGEVVATWGGWVAAGGFVGGLLGGGLVGGLLGGGVVPPARLRSLPAIRLTKSR